jgi:hypothetical protein
MIYVITGLPIIAYNLFDIGTMDNLMKYLIIIRP